MRSFFYVVATLDCCKMATLLLQFFFIVIFSFCMLFSHVLCIIVCVLDHLFFAFWVCMYNCVLALFSAIVLLITSCTLLSICSHFALVRYLQILVVGFTLLSCFLVGWASCFLIAGFSLSLFCVPFVSLCCCCFFSAFFLVSCVVFIAKKSPGYMFLAC